MRVSVALAALTLPLFAAAESPFEQYKAQFQNFLSSFGATAPKADKPAAAPSSTSSSKGKEKPLHIITLGDWKETLYAPVKAGATKPEEWWVLVSGRNKTCYGQCLQAETAFNQTAAKFATLPNTPHMGLLNCDAEAVLCSSWSAAPGNVWVIEMLPPPADINIYRKRLNLTTVDTKTFTELQALDSRESLLLNDSVFHPFNGWFAKNNLSLPVGYFLWGFNLIPNWLFMIVVSFVSRTMMSRRMDNHMNRGAGAAAPAPAPAAAL